MGVEAKDVVTLWLQENSIVNQKTAYYFASVSILAWPVVFCFFNKLVALCIALSVLGLTFSVVSFFSIARTSAYRSHWRSKVVEMSSDYKNLFSDIKLHWYEKVDSNFVLVCVPVLGVLTWFAALGYFIYVFKCG